MKLLELFILRRVTQMFLLSLLPVLAIIWTIQVLGRINLVTDTGQSMGSFMTLATLILPTIVPIVLPFALVIGITQTLTTMNNDSELVVIDAAGATRSIVIRPILMLAAVLSLFSFFVSNFVEPQSRTAARQMVAAAYADLLSSVIEEKTFRTIQDGLYVQISERQQGRILKGLFIADQRDPAFDLVYYAREGAIDESGTSLTMKDGEVHRKTADGRVSIIRFDSYAFDLSAMAATRGEPRIHASDRGLAYLFNPEEDDPSFVSSPGNFRAELHRRLTEWTLPFVFAMISLVLAGDARSHRQSRVHPMIIALIMAFALRGMVFYAGNQTSNNAAWMPVMYAIPIVSIAASIFLLHRQKRTLLASTLSETISRHLGVLRERIEAMSRLRKGGA